ncbi:hypothetical protein V7O66_04555 [Methanolobus sp. ZRKC3]|uniref:hypothetical protein n=1 Tax=Methanolobus sp. ZRKC3 TaxID=3125786 RepID=UPI003255E14B
MHGRYEKYNTDVWKEGQHFPEIVNEMENPAVISKRLVHAYSIFGERIKYAGPDCGLGSWPSKKIAAQLLRNTAERIADFKKRL